MIRIGLNIVKSLLIPPFQGGRLEKRYYESIRGQIRSDLRLKAGGRGHGAGGNREVRGGERD